MWHLKMCYYLNNSHGINRLHKTNSLNVDEIQKLLYKYDTTWEQSLICSPVMCGKKGL